MSVSLFNQNLKEARRDALVSHYLATHDFSSLPEGSSVTTADDLYEYLLLDTKISNAVTTSRLAEAISSLQLFIHRSLEGYEGELAEEATKYLAKDAFLDNWDQYNKRYSTWAGKEKLRFYAGNYVDPSLRMGKTTPFNELEQTISQSKLTEDIVNSALKKYIDQYDVYSGMQFLTAGYARSSSTTENYYLTGKRYNNYYWREVKCIDGKPYYWSEWHNLPSAIVEPVEDMVLMTYSPEGAMCRWFENKKNEEGSDERLFLKTSVQYSSGVWQSKEDVLQDYSNYLLDVSLPDTSEDLFQKISLKVQEEHSVTINYKVLFLTNYLDGDVKVSFQEATSSTATVSIKSLTGVRVTLEDGSIIDSGEDKNITVDIDKDIQLKFAYPDISYSGITVSFRVKHKTHDLELNYFYGQVNDDGYLITKNDVTTFSVTSPGQRFRPELSINGISALLDYRTQASNASAGKWYYEGSTLGGDAFTGPYGLYLWEIFFHIPYLVATRFAIEQRFEEAERWYKYIFNSAGYRDEDGNIQTDDNGQPRYWNCYPLQQDVAWDSFADMPASTDPDVIATADPMHYKLAIFRHTLDLLIARGDAAWRLLERDTLTEAKMYYVQALQLLGPRPDIRVTNTWDNPTLSAEADAIQNPVTLSGEGASLTFARWLRAGDTNEMGDGDFLPPYNDVLLAYWDKLDIRLYNLRHNLSLDGQPLSLPLFATPVDPAELHRQQAGGDGLQGDVPPAAHAGTGWRYPLLAVKAQEAVSRLREFGSGLLSALEKQDNEKVAMLLQSQQSNVLGMQQEIVQKNLEGLNAELAALNSSREGLVLNQKYYTSLINGDLSAAEIAGLTLRSGSMLLNTAAGVTLLPAGTLRAIPNIFGMANGGADLGAPVESSAFNMQIAAQVLDQSAQVSEVTASYQRRAADWRQQSALTTKSIEEIDNRIASLKAQIAMQQKQIALAEMEYANHQAYLDLYNSRFTGLTLYSWMVTRLSSLYYQLYDATLPVCIHALEALKRELGKNRADGIFSMPVWNDLYQGLLAGEGLTTELQKLEDIWLQNSANGLEATRTVSLAALRGEKSGSLSASIAKVLNNKEEGNVDDQLKLDGNIFSAVLDMSKLQLANDYGVTGSNKNLFTKSISVTLPTLLGPYQDIAATLSDGNGTVATLSHGMQDTGRFVVNFDDSRFLPFEGSDPTSLILTLSIFNVKESGDAAPNQRAIVENLSDIIFHIRYIMRDRQS
ncbi:TPA: Insecticidal toxin complex protein TcaB (toxin complex protein) [Enterobacter bugandensis]|nr:Insecticidal toxin complex protein TcaB (toxin complex protein) [Enterobacter bugandensis]